MSQDIQKLFVSKDATLLDVLRVQTSAKEFDLPAGIALVVDGNDVLCGTLTDGDVRRALVSTGRLDAPAASAMNKNPITFKSGSSYREILNLLPTLLEERGRKAQSFLGKIIVVDDNKRPEQVFNYHKLWEQRVATHRHVVVLGMGYVGLTLALVLADQGFRVTGVDVDKRKVDALKSGESHVHEIGLNELLREQIGKSFDVSTDIPEDGDVYIMSVGTPVVAKAGGDPEPVMSMVEDATRAIAKKMKRGALVVLRSTVPVGCCRETVIPILEQETGWTAGTDFHVSFAPERTIEGKALSELRSLPQVIGGINRDSVEATVALFRELTPTIVRVKSLEAAEFVKLLNNSFRDLVFAFANEMSQVAKKFDVDVHEVISAANRGYPRNKIPLPSPGVGGPCLTKDPYILGFAAGEEGRGDTLSVLGRRVNESMLDFVAESIDEAVRDSGKTVADAKILLCGLAFKGQPETGDLRNSCALEIAQLLRQRGYNLYGYDPVASTEEVAAHDLTPVELPNGFDGMDGVVFLNNHRSFNSIDVYEMMRSLADKPFVYDGWHAFREDDITGARSAQYLTLGYRSSTLDGALS